MIGLGLRLVLDPRADFLLEPADSGPNPWTLELPSSRIADGSAPARSAREKATAISTRPGTTMGRK